MKRQVLLALIAAIIVVPAVAGVLIHTLRSGSSASPAASGPPPGAYRGSEPPAGIRLPTFALRDYRGGLVRTSALRGKVVLVTFLDTDCKTKCPVFASDIGAALRLLSSSERRQVAALALTVNPARDTPASVRAFLRRRHALEIDFLLGSVKQMRPIWKAFHVISAAETGNADVHSSDARVYDRSGVWVSTLHLPVDLTAPNLAHDIRTALAQPVSAQAAVTIAALKRRFDLLSRQHSNKCSLRPESLDSIAVHGRLQGSCCSAMDFQRYVRQMHGLRTYARVAEIPTDPYDVPVTLARRLTSYAESITLTPSQQTVYDGAVKLSHEHGPCCCHCWRWTAFEGQAKYLIARRGYSGRRVAEIWDLDDGCGGNA
jgi:cytochrome oxidase Cu insertion factor (SCO1/SenC/PrrC family)